MGVACKPSFIAATATADAENCLVTTHMPHCFGKLRNIEESARYSALQNCWSPVHLCHHAKCLLDFILQNVCQLPDKYHSLAEVHAGNSLTSTYNSVVTFCLLAAPLAFIIIFERTCLGRPTFGTSGLKQRMVSKTSGLEYSLEFQIS